MGTGGFVGGHEAPARTLQWGQFWRFPYVVRPPAPVCGKWSPHSQGTVGAVCCYRVNAQDLKAQRWPMLPLPSH